MPQSLMHAELTELTEPEYRSDLVRCLVGKIRTVRICHKPHKSKGKPIKTINKPILTNEEAREKIMP